MERKSSMKKLVQATIVLNEEEIEALGGLLELARIHVEDALHPYSVAGISKQRAMSTFPDRCGGANVHELLCLRNFLSGFFDLLDADN